MSRKTVCSDFLDRSGILPYIPSQLHAIRLLVSITRETVCGDEIRNKIDDRL
jgi:hypothetical protein